MGRSLTIDRSELADTTRPDRLAELLLKQLAPQLGPSLLPLPIDDVAKACGIEEISLVDTDAFEGCLLQDEVKSRGGIFIRASSPLYRRRFTVGHELGHFVNLRHVTPSGQDRFTCTTEYLREQGKSANPRLGIEAQANEFAACLLMPKAHIPKNLFRGSPEIARILELHRLCDVSKEAAARRYVELHGDDFAVVFSENGKFKYAAPSTDFPRIDLRAGQELFRKTLTREFDGSEGDVSDQEEADPAWWLLDRDVKRWAMWEEVLVQRNGHRLTLLSAEQLDDD
jgi:hypothetical protein